MFNRFLNSHNGQILCINMSINSFDLLYKFNYECKINNDFIIKNNEKYKKIDLNVDTNMNANRCKYYDNMKYMFLWL